MTLPCPIQTFFSPFSSCRLRPRYMSLQRAGFVCVLENYGKIEDLSSYFFLVLGMLLLQRVSQRPKHSDSKNSSDYICTILTESNISALRKANINLIVIGRGAHSSSLARYRSELSGERPTIYINRWFFRTCEK